MLLMHREVGCAAHFKSVWCSGQNLHSPKQSMQGLLISPNILVYEPQSIQNVLGELHAHKHVSWAVHEGTICDP